MFSALRKGEALAKQFTTNGDAGKDLILGAERGNKSEQSKLPSGQGFWGTILLLHSLHFFCITISVRC